MTLIINNTTKTPHTFPKPSTPPLIHIMSDGISKINNEIKHDVNKIQSQGNRIANDARKQGNKIQHQVQNGVKKVPKPRGRV